MLKSNKLIPTLSLHGDKSNFKLSKGEYVVCDPCYVFNDETWNDICDNLYSYEKANESYFWKFITNDGNYFFIISVGDDGVYDFEGSDLFVDSGCLSLIPKYIVDEQGCLKNYEGYEEENFFKRITVNETSIIFSDYGKIHIGNHQLDIVNK